MKIAFCLKCGIVVGNFSDSMQEIPPLCMTCDRQEPVVHPNWHHPVKKRRIIAQFETFIPTNDEPWEMIRSIRSIEKKPIDDVTPFQNFLIEGVSQCGTD